MADVEIISMLMPSSASVSNIGGGHAGVRLHAGADRATPWRCRRRSATLVGADLGGERPGDARRRRPGRSWGTVKEMSVCPWLGHVLHDHVDVDVAVGQRAGTGGRRCRAGRARRSTVTLASDVSWTTAEMMACSMVGSSSVDPGARLPGEARADVQRARRGCGRTRPTAWPASGSRLAHISSISSKLTRAPCGGRSGTTRGSAVNTPDTSV